METLVIRVVTLSIPAGKLCQGPSYYEHLRGAFLGKAFDYVAVAWLVSHWAKQRGYVAVVPCFALLSTRSLVNSPADLLTLPVVPRRDLSLSTSPDIALKLVQYLAGSESHSYPLLGCSFRLCAVSGCLFRSISYRLGPDGPAGGLIH